MVGYERQSKSSVTDKFWTRGYRWASKLCWEFFCRVCQLESYFIWFSFDDAKTICQNIRDVYRLHRTELDSIEDEEAKHRRLVELNIVEQCLNLYKTVVVQKGRLETYHDPDEPMTIPRIHGLVFDPAIGILKEVPIDYRRSIQELRSTYDLFDIDELDTETPDYFLPKDGKPAAL